MARPSRLTTHPFRSRPEPSTRCSARTARAKSTIVKLLSGLAQPDAGGFRIFGERVRFASPRDSQARGIQTAFQEMTLVDDLTVLDNMLLPCGPTGPTGMIRRRSARAAVAAHFDALGMGDIHLDDEIGGLDLAIQQKIEIARAIFRRPAHPAARRADVDTVGPRRRLARRDHQATCARRA